jgi:polysaccharide biosynthesis/export protein
MEVSWAAQTSLSEQPAGVVMKLMPCRILAVGIFAVVFAGCLRSQTQPAQPPASQLAPATGSAGGGSAPASVSVPHNDTFVIGNDDVLSINVWKETDLTHSIPVRSDGKISLPLVGELQAAGRTPLQLEGDIADRLKSYITAPQVSVMVQEIKSQNFNIMGMVAKPGSYSLTEASTMMDAIAKAGGFKDFAKSSKIYIVRPLPDGGQTHIEFNYKDFIKGKNLDKNKNVKLEPHDTIVVP